jgi:hypothetical protein
MNRFGPTFVLIGLLLLAAVSRAADVAPSIRVGGGLAEESKLVKLTDDSITIVPQPRPPRQAPNPRNKPANPQPAPAPAAAPEQTVKIDKEKTRVGVLVVTAERMMVNGEVIRSMTALPGSPADLKVGQTVRVRATEGVATEIMVGPPIVGDAKSPALAPKPSKVLKVEEGKILVRPPGPRPAQAGAEEAPAPPDQTYTTDKDKTRVVFAVTAPDRKLDNGQIVRSVRFQHATLADLKPGQTVEVLAFEGSAREIRIAQPAAEEPAEKKDETKPKAN